MSKERREMSYNRYENLGWQRAREKAYTILKEKYPEAAQFLLDNMKLFPGK